MKCGFCRNIRLFFTLANKHRKAFIEEYKSFLNVCEIANTTEFDDVKVPDVVQDIRKPAKENYEENALKDINEESRRSL